MQKNTYLSQRARLIKNLRKAIAGFAIGASLSACSTVELVPLPPEVSTGLAGKKIVLTKYPTPNFVPITAGAMAFAVVGIVAAMAEGHEIVESNGLEDPALMISQ